MSKESSFLQSKFYDWVRDITSLANPLILIFVPLLVLGISKTYFTLLIALVINEVIGSVIKITFPKVRPNGQKYTNLAEKIDAGSFPSLHSSRITIVYLTMFYFQEVFSIKIIILVFMFAVIGSRIILKKHFFIDVIGGFFVGAAIWYFVTYTHSNI